MREHEKCPQTSFDKHRKEVFDVLFSKHVLTIFRDLKLEATLAQRLIYKVLDD